MNGFYCDDFYWAVEVDGLARGLFVIESDAWVFYADECDGRPEQRVALWRLNGGHLCMPEVDVRPDPSDGREASESKASDE